MSITVGFLNDFCCHGPEPSLTFWRGLILELEDSDMAEAATEVRVGSVAWVKLLPAGDVAR